MDRISNKDLRILAELNHKTNIHPFFSFENASITAFINGYRECERHYKRRLKKEPSELVKNVERRLIK